MPVSIKVSKDLQRLLSNSNDGLAAKVRQRYMIKGAIKLKQAIVQDMIKGVSPVNGVGKWQKYSDSYKDVIRNKAAFRIIKGRVVRFGTGNEFGLSNKQFSSLRPNAAARKARTSAKKSGAALIKDLNADFMRRSSPTKQVSPVNLRHSGELHKSLKVFQAGGFLSTFRLVVEFRNKLADIHNRLGAGKSKVIRRLLPTRGGETFNRRISQNILSELQSAVNFVVKQFNGQ